MAKSSAWPDRKLSQWLVRIASASSHNSWEYIRTKFDFDLTVAIRKESSVNGHGP